MPPNKSPILLYRAAIMLGALLSLQLGSMAAFTVTETFTLARTGHYGIASAGDEWLIAALDQDYIRVYDQDFVFTGEQRPLSSGAGAYVIFGMTYAAEIGNMFAVDVNSGRILEFTVAGDFIGAIDSGFPRNSLSGVAYNPIDDTFWLSEFDEGQIANISRSGTLIRSFDTPFEWAGIEVDSRSGTLLVMEDNDTIYEYDFSGNLIEIVVPDDQIFGNGLGLSYDESTGRLYANNQGDQVVVFSDPARIPEPTIGVLLVISTTLLSLRRRRTR